MIFITIPLFLATAAWTAVFVFAYNDWSLILRGSLPAWAVFSAVWALTHLIRLVFRGMSTSERSTSGTGALLSRAVVTTAVSVAIFVLAVSAPDWLDTGDEAVSETFAVDLTRTAEPPVRVESQRLVRKEVTAKAPKAEEVLPRAIELWSVQVGAFRSEQDAFELARSLRKKGYSAYVMQAEVDSVSLYRAKVGRFRTRDEAERLLEVLRNKEAYTAAFVSKM